MAGSFTAIPRATSREDIRRLAWDASRLNVDAFGHLYRLYFTSISRYVASRIAECQEAEDLAHAVFEKAFAAIGHYEPSPAQFSTWLYTIARNAVTDHYRKRRLPNEDGARQEICRAADPADGPEEIVLADERRARLYQAISELTEEQRQVVAYRFFFNLSVREAAQAMGKTEGAIKALQFRALDRLHRHLAPDISSM